ncbi:hypothetical protein FRX31_019840 [Thalictrum thalictroides]|uniref:Uncharacterized protein n=1 Tax=Thalictrum thalictroides TaxID=46969 RepID=A0A7J6W0G2_THATH|nr:hypothetical protein FRX31_019840 [Thalictrum thalictroides]
MVKPNPPHPMASEGMVEALQEFTKDMTIMAIHVYREGNTPADHLSKQGLLHKCMGAINYQVDKTLKIALLSDKENIPQIRHSR